VIDAILLRRAQEMVDRKYAARADERQKSMGLAYVEAERQDLAREIVRFVEPYLDHAASLFFDAAAERDALALQVLTLTAERDEARALGRIA
jgi:hypothetical protein